MTYVAPGKSISIKSFDGCCCPLEQTILASTPLHGHLWKERNKVPRKDKSVLKQEHTRCLFRNRKEKNQKREEPRINGGDTQAQQSKRAASLLVVGKEECAQISLPDEFKALRWTKTHVPTDSRHFLSWRKDEGKLNSFLLYKLHLAVALRKKNYGKTIKFPRKEITAVQLVVRLKSGCQATLLQKTKSCCGATQTQQ